MQAHETVRAGEHKAGSREYERQAYDQLMRRIKWWGIATVVYRGLNVVLFFLFKGCVPIFSAIVAANLALATRGEPLIGNIAMVWMAISILVFSGLDIALNPREKKVIGLKFNLDLSSLREKTYLELAGADSIERRLEVLKMASSELHDLLEAYAKKGFGSPAEGWDSRP